MSSGCARRRVKASFAAFARSCGLRSARGTRSVRITLSFTRMSAVAATACDAEGAAAGTEAAAGAACAGADAADGGADAVACAVTGADADADADADAAAGAMTGAAGPSCANAPLDAAKTRHAIA